MNKLSYFLLLIALCCGCTKTETLLVTPKAIVDHHPKGINLLKPIPTFNYPDDNLYNYLWRWENEQPTFSPEISVTTLKVKKYNAAYFDLDYFQLGFYEFELKFDAKSLEEGQTISADVFVIPHDCGFGGNEIPMTKAKEWVKYTFSTNKDMPEGYNNKIYLYPSDVLRIRLSASSETLFDNISFVRK
jgi:hypothetical protein